MISGVDDGRGEIVVVGLTGNEIAVYFAYAGEQLLGVLLYARHELADFALLWHSQLYYKLTSRLHPQIHIHTTLYLCLALRPQISPSSSLYFQFYKASQPKDALLHSFPCGTRTADYLILPFKVFKVENVLYFFQRACALDVALVGVEEQGYLVGDGPILKDEVEFAFGNAYAHLIAAVDHENDAVDLVLLVNRSRVGLPQITILGLAGHVQYFIVDSISRELVLLIADGGRNAVD